MKLKVLTGQYKNSNLKVGQNTKPTKAIIKKSIFDYMQNLVDFKSVESVCDLYAGSGALGIEALSRGVNFAVFVEKHPLNAKLIQQNLLNINLQNKGEVIAKDALKYIGEGIELFNIVFADLPYNDPHSHFLKTAHLIIKPKGYLVYVHKSNLNEEADELTKIHTKKFGKSSFTVYKAN